MSKRNRIITANDNMPSPEPAMAYHQSANLVKLSSEDIGSISDSYGNSQTAQNMSGANRSLKLSVVLWLVSIFIGLTNFIVQTNTEVKSLSALAVLWAGLWTSYVAADHNKWRLSELAIVSALGGLMSAITIASNYFGLNLKLVDGIILMSLLSLAMGYVLKSRIALLASICATLLWAVMSFIGLTPINNMAMLFPLFITLQIYSGARIKSGLSIKLSTLTGYFGLIGLLATLWVDNLIPVTFAASLVFIIGVAQHRLGKASEDAKIIGSNIHIFTGWVIAVMSAVIFQYFWLSPDAALSNEASMSASGLAMWKVAVSLSIFAIFVSGIIRFKNTQITLPGIFLLTFCSALLPLMMWMPSWTETLATTIPGISAVPTFGVIIGAGIIAAAIGFALNGVRRGSRLMLLLGLTTLGVETILLMNPAFITIDNIIIFVASLITALAIGGAIAGNSLAFQAPAPRLNHV